MAAKLFRWHLIIGVSLFIIGTEISMVVGADSRIRVSSTEDTNKNGIEGFGTSFQCSVNVCLSGNQKVKWYKNNQLIADGVKALKDRMYVDYSADMNLSSCSGQCSVGEAKCPSPTVCNLDEYKCCECNKEEFKLTIQNLTLADSGKYKCQLDDGNSVEIRLTVMEGGTSPSFGQNLTFNHSACCQERGMSKNCLPMCRPGLLETHKFDPIPCQKEFSKLLHCATEGGNISHTHCCRLHFVPAFCWEYCSGANTDFSRSNRLCVYWMPEIFQCYEQAYLPFPGPPEGLVVNAVNASVLEACWDVPERNAESIRFYSVRYQEVPRFPLLGGAIPFLTADGDLPSSPEGDVSAAPIDEEADGDFAPVVLNPGRPRTPPPPPPPVPTNRNDKAVAVRPHGRQRRQTLIITTHNFATNETDVREYKYLEVNTTETCAAIMGLKPSTQYFIYVTATNDYGTSLPSLRQTALTDAITYPNQTLPNINQCCIDKKVEAQCLPKICDVEHPPMSSNAFDLAFTCRNEFSNVSPCLADGRDHTQCCKDKGVVGDCLKFCDGSVTQMGMSSVLCLSLDIQAIFTCFREGYIKLPSPPQNVTVRNVDSNGAEILWKPPVVNDDKVNNYSLFYRHSALEQYVEVTDAKSPYVLTNLEADRTYSVYIVARGSLGSSLKSSIVSFSTGEPEYQNVCEYGKPLLDAYGKPLRCSRRLKCPESHKCVDSETDDPDLKYCCPINNPTVGPTIRLVAPNVTACCAARNVSKDCVHLCTYDITKKDILDAEHLDCLPYAKTFLECGVDGRNDVPCCEKAGVSGDCLDLCRQAVDFSHLEKYFSCLPVAEKMIKCAQDGAINLPGPPINVTIEDQGPAWVTLHWQRPRQLPPVDHYEILFNNISTGNATGLSTTVSTLEANKFYSVRVVSWNSRGSSLPSNEVNFTTSGSGTASDRDDFPRPPTNVQKVSFANGTANVTWKWPPLTVTGKTIDRYQFKVQYRLHPSSGLIAEGWKNVSTTVPFALLENLSLNKTYDVKVSVVNLASGHEGLASEIGSISTAVVLKDPVIDLHFSPSGPFKNGSSTSIICSATGEPTPRVSLSQGSLQRSQGLGNVTFILGLITPKTGLEPIVCEADNGGTKVQKSEYVKVQYKPIVSPSKTSTIRTYQDLPASLACDIITYPEAKISWFMESRPDAGADLTEKENYRPKLETVKENTFTATLLIEKTQLADSGAYVCRACNELGCGNATIMLKVEKVPMPKSPADVEACCKKANVKSTCMSVCTSEMNINEYSKNDQECSSEFAKLLSCAKDGLDNRPCCINRRVPETCLNYCDGAMPSSLVDVTSSVSDCSTYQNQIINCVQQGHEKLPLPPESLKAVVLPDGRMNVSWKVPGNSPERSGIRMYSLFYKASSDQNYSSLISDKPYVVVGNLKPNTQYSFTSSSKNAYGWSSFAPLYSTTSAAKNESSSSSAGVVLGVLFCLLLAVVVILAFVYFSRRPYKLPTFLLKMGNRHKQTDNGAVAFENPGYDKEGQVRGLPGDHLDGDGPSSSHDAGWENARLESPNDGDQRGMRYAPLN